MNPASQAVFKFLSYLIVFSLIPCLYLMASQHFALKSGRVCEGTVIGYIPRPVTKHRTDYALKIEYTAPDAGQKSFVTSNSANPPAEPIGAKVRVFHYENGRAPNLLLFQELYLGYWLWLCVGLCVAGCLAAPAVLSFLYDPMAR